MNETPTGDKYFPTSGAHPTKTKSNEKIIISHIETGWTNAFIENVLKIIHSDFHNLWIIISEPAACSGISGTKILFTVLDQLKFFPGTPHEIRFRVFGWYPWKPEMKISNSINRKWSGNIFLFLAWFELLCQNEGYIDVGDGYWRRNQLVTIFRCLVTNHVRYRCWHQHIKIIHQHQPVE